MMAASKPAPCVSVIMAVKDSARFLPATLASLEAQTLQDWELVAVDDGSSDGSMELIKSRLGSRAVVGSTGGGKGPAVARNQAFATAQGSYLAILDSDDLARPTRFEQQVRWLETHPCSPACAAWAQVLGSPLTAIAGRHSGSLRASLIFRNPVVHSTLMIRRPIPPLPLALFDESLRYSHDYELISRLAFKGDVRVLTQILGDYRIHAQQVTQVHAEAQMKFAMEAQRRLLLKFGIQPGDTGAALHYRLGLGAGLASELELGAASDWLGTIIEANRVSAVLPHSEITRVIGQVWAMTCIKSPLSPLRASRCWLRQARNMGLVDCAAFSQMMTSRLCQRLARQIRRRVSRLSAD